MVVNHIGKKCEMKNMSSALEVKKNKNISSALEVKKNISSALERKKRHLEQIAALLQVHRQCWEAALTSMDDR